MKERCKDLVGRWVRLLEGITTRGGREFSKGDILKIDSTHRGRFALSYPAAPTIGIRQVPRFKFKVLGTNQAHLERLAESDSKK